jgi:MFS family permease
MVGLGETYLPAFALAIGFGQVVSGLVASVPIFVGGMVQLLAHRFLPGCASYKRWVVITSTLQALAFIPLVIAAVYGSISIWVLFAVASLYWASGLAAGPAWNTWIAQIVPIQIRPNFFAKRNRFTQLATFGGFLLGGFFLYLGKYSGNVLLGFACIFLVAFASRIVSAVFLGAHRQPRPRGIRTSTATESARNEHFSPKGKRLILYLVCIQAFVQFSGPYFTPYMLKQLNFSYNAFVFLIGVSFVSKAFAFALWGRIGQRRGAEFLLWMGGIGIIPASFLWTLSNSIAWLATVQIISGIVWAAYELGFFLRFLQDIPQKRRAQLLTYYNFANATAWCGGALLGGWYLATWSASFEAYHGLFMISSVGRCACLLLLWNVDRHGMTRIWNLVRRASVRPNIATSTLPAATASAGNHAAETTTHAA